MLRRLNPAALAVLLVAGAGCDGGGTGPKLAPCTAAGFPVSLAVGQYASIDPVPDSGCTVFPANASATDSAEYLVVPQLATGEPGKTSSFLLVGDTIRPATLSPPAHAAPAIADLSPAQQFEVFLRTGDRNRWRDLPQIVPGSPEPVARSAAAPAGPPTYGSTRGFKVCANLTCTKFNNVTATARAVQSKVAIFVDNTAPVSGLDSASLDSLATVFDTRLYAVDTAAFGRESDIDTNGVVLVLMTGTVNKLVSTSDCTSKGFVAGFFFGGDLTPSFANSNRGEVFYSIVADPSGTLSCAHSTDAVKRLVPVTFIHEFQHMISFNQHVLLRGGDGEVLWLNEGFSHYAEELGGRSYGVGTPDFSRFAIGDVFNAFQYLDSVKNHFLVPTAGIGSIEERGAAWLFVRYLVDRYSTDTSTANTNVFSRSMLATTLTGAQNVANATGDPFDVVVSRWALTQWVSDLPTFTAPPELQYITWHFRTTYASLNTQDPGNFPKPFPLTPTVSAGRATNLNGTLHAGSGLYHRVLQPPLGVGFTLRFGTGSNGPLPATLFPRLNVIRIR